jgi:hypothetical protein
MTFWHWLLALLGIIDPDPLGYIRNTRERLQMYTRIFEHPGHRGEW